MGGGWEEERLIAQIDIAFRSKRESHHLSLKYAGCSLLGNSDTNLSRRIHLPWVLYRNYLRYLRYYLLSERTRELSSLRRLKFSISMLSVSLSVSFSCNAVVFLSFFSFCFCRCCCFSFFLNIC